MTTQATDLEQTLLTLCSVQSFTGEEGPLCDLVERELVAILGRDSVQRDGHSLVASPLVKGAEASIVLAGHLDVVRTAHDGPARVEGDRLYGPGAADMKSGLAVMLHLARETRSRTPRYAPTFVFYEGEEGPASGNRLGVLLERFPELRTASLAVCLEPSSSRLQLGCMGSMHARITFRGRSAHSARPWQGENAVYKAAGLLGRLGALEPRDVVISGLTYREVISATMAEGGRGRNVVPDTFTLNLNARFAPGRTSDEAAAEVQALVAGEADVEIVDRAPSALPNREHPMVRELQRAGGIEAVEPKQAWTDVARFVAAGVIAVNLGPGTQAQAHQRNEWTDRRALADGLTLFRRWLFSQE